MIARSLTALLLSFALLTSAFGQSGSSYSIEIDLQEQTAHLIQDGRAVLSTPICSGRARHYTETGAFQIIEKERNHFSNMYGQIVDPRGDTIVADADADMPVPRGGKFAPAPMRYFMRFNGAIGMHAGYLPGYAASHGCVRLPEANAIAFFNAIEVGTPVTVFGVTPRGRMRNNNYDPSMPRRGFAPQDRRWPPARPPWWR